MDDWIYVSWFIIVFVMVVFGLYALRPRFLLENCSCEDSDKCRHCEIHPLLTIWAAIIIAAIVVIIQWCAYNY